MSIFNRRPVPEVEVTAAGPSETDVLLDVREADEWHAGHAPGAVWVPLRELESVRFELPMNRRIVVVCRSGARSATATQALLDWGFDAVNLAGGMQAWARMGHPVVTDAGVPGAVR